MKAKSIATAVLGLFVVASIAYMAVPKPNEKSAGDLSSAQASNKVAKGKTVLVYYFYDSVRCQTCHKIERLTKETLEESYAKQFADGKLIWKPINVDEPGNEHYLADYGIMSKSVVVSELKDGKQVRWSNLNRVWELIKDDGAFKKYIHDGVAEILETD